MKSMLVRERGVESIDGESLVFFFKTEDGILFFSLSRELVFVFLRRCVCVCVCVWVCVCVFV